MQLPALLQLLLVLLLLSLTRRSSSEPCRLQTAEYASRHGMLHFGLVVVNGGLLCERAARLPQLTRAELALRCLSCGHHIKKIFKNYSSDKMYDHQGRQHTYLAIPRVLLCFVRLKLPQGSFARLSWVSGSCIPEQLGAFVCEMNFKVDSGFEV